MNKDEFQKSPLIWKKRCLLQMKNRVSDNTCKLRLVHLCRQRYHSSQRYGWCVRALQYLPSCGRWTALQLNCVASKSETNINDLRANLELLVSGVSNSMNDTLTDTSAFSEMIDKSFEDLSRVDNESLSIDEVDVVGSSAGSRYRNIRWRRLSS